MIHLGALQKQITRAKSETQWDYCLMVESLGFARWKGSGDLSHNNVNIPDTNELHT